MKFNTYYLKFKVLITCFITFFLLLIFIGCSAEDNDKKNNNHSSNNKIVKINQAAIDIQKPHTKEFTKLTTPSREPTTITLNSVYVSEEPIIDGKGIDKIWDNIKEITTLDYASSRPISIKSAHTNDRIFFLVKFPDVSKSETHKSYGWDYKEKVYKQLYDREDTFVFKWSMVGNDVNLSFREPMPHVADVWFWKAKRTNPSGYADDKIQTLSNNDAKSAFKVPDPKNKNVNYYLDRRADKGQGAYKQRFLFDYIGDVEEQYLASIPSGSRGDIFAKGVWQDGFWTIEFSRKLITNNDDDIQFKKGQTYLFGVGTSEMAFDKVHPEFSVPLYRVGDVFDRLLLKIE